MSYFITFYSFKGGVGRTLALANVATLLAKDKREPCRVLVWDFDLAAPGLQQVFKAKWSGPRRGFVEYVHHYLTNASMDDIRGYIYQTDVENVDVLPAGVMDADYATKLEQIRWKEIYRQMRGFQFIEALKAQISGLHPSYDYVLVDSLTGYSDIGGICVQQMPDSIVLLFRLNQQNITGISKVFKAVRRGTQGKGRTTPVVPVISPAWPFASLEANDWLPRAKRVFSDTRIYEVSFDGDLSYGEKVIAKSMERYEIAPRIVEDYRRLTGRLRELNPNDYRTISRNVQKLTDDHKFPEAVELCTELVKGRPRRGEYWTQLVHCLSLAPKNTQVQLRQVTSRIVNEHCEQDNPFALMARAHLAYGLDNDAASALRDLDRAVEIRPNDPEILQRRAQIRFGLHQYANALRDLTTAAAGLKAPSDSLLFLKGRCYLEMSEFEKALSDFSAAALIDPSDVGNQLFLAKAHYGMGNYEQAMSDIEQAIKLAPFFGGPRVFKAFLLSATGNKKEAGDLLDHILSETPDDYDKLNIAEAFLAVDPGKTLAVLSSIADKDFQGNIIAFALRAIADRLLGRKESWEQVFKALNQKQGDFPWDFFELKAFIRSPAIDPRVRSDIAALLCKLENADLPVLEPIT
jgi:MinD-like ATPase involved in chromosome partitioning or flagellar assembly/tetratricopeptide (TPR) repeat protein